MKQISESRLNKSILYRAYRALLRPSVLHERVYTLIKAGPRSAGLHRRSASKLGSSSQTKWYSRSLFAGAVFFWTESELVCTAKMRKPPFAAL